MDKAKKINSWIDSPITKRKEVLVEYDDKNRESKMCIGSGYFTNEYPLNYKKHKDFKIEKYEKTMPKLMKDLRFDDGESYWYPSTVQTEHGIVFPDGDSIEDWKWCYAPIKHLSEEEIEQSSDIVEYTSKIDMDNAKRYDRYLDAVKNVKGFSLNELK